MPKGRLLGEPERAGEMEYGEGTGDGMGLELIRKFWRSPEKLGEGGPYMPIVGTMRCLSIRIGRADSELSPLSWSWSSENDIPNIDSRSQTKR